jgi:hypothetical protein
MAGLADSDDEETLALALRLSQLSSLSSDDSDEQIPRNPPEGSASANQSRPRTPTSDEKDDLALALRLSLAPYDDFDEQLARFHRTGFASTSKEACPSTPPNESEEDDVGRALILSQLPADIFDEQVRGLNQRREARTAIEGSLASLPIAISLAQVRATHSLRCNKPLNIMLGRDARRFQSPAAVGFGLRLFGIAPA